MNEKLTYIPIEMLYEHPKNPRKEIGDIEELTESIKAKGVLQNLTVVRGHARTAEEYAAASREYAENPTEEARVKLNKGWEDSGYTIIIGHRRFNAAKRAGLEVLPCVVAKMDEKEQIATMLLENIQRRNLTLIEEAEGFQMMLDLGDSVKDVSEKTGFSQSTVRRRLKLCELDRKELEAAEARGGTLDDYAKLDEIKDEEEKTRVLKAIGTKDFAWTLNNALAIQKNEIAKGQLIEKLKTIAEETEDTTGMICVYTFYSPYKDDVDEKVGIYGESGAVYRYRVGERWINLSREKTEEEKTLEEENKRLNESEREQRTARIASQKAAAVTAFKMRQDFIWNMTAAEAIKNSSVIMEFAAAVMCGSFSKGDNKVLKNMTGIELVADWKTNNREAAEKVREAFMSKAERNEPIRKLLYVTYGVFNDGAGSYYNNYNGDYIENRDLDVLYEYLERLGYEEAEEESAWRRGEM